MILFPHHPIRTKSAFLPQNILQHLKNVFSAALPGSTEHVFRFYDSNVQLCLDWPVNRDVGPSNLVDHVTIFRVSPSRRI